MRLVMKQYDTRQSTCFYYFKTGCLTKTNDTNGTLSKGHTSPSALAPKAGGLQKPLLTQNQS